MHRSAPERKPRRYLCVRQYLPSVSGHDSPSGAFAGLRKVATSFFMSVRVEQLGFHWMDYYEILYLRILRKYIEKIRVSLESAMLNEYCVVCTFMIVSRGILLTMAISKEMHRTQYLQNRTPDVRGSVIVLQCSPPSVE